MDKILESLRKLLPEESLSEVTSAVEDMVNEVKKELTNEFNAQLEEAYAELAAEKEEAEKTAIQGYHEAYALINDLRNRMELMREEYEQEQHEGFEEAYEMIKKERSKNQNLSREIYEEYDAKLDQMKEFFADKLDEFLHTKGEEIYEQAKRDILSDPMTLEHKVAMDKIAEIVSKHVILDEQFFTSSSKLEETSRRVKDLEAQIRMMEGRNIKLSHDNTSLNERLREAVNCINENRQYERKNRKPQQVSGRGHRVYNEEDVVVIAENNNNVKRVHAKKEEPVNSIKLELSNKELDILAGTIKRK